MKQTWNWANVATNIIYTLQAQKNVYSNNHCGIFPSKAFMSIFTYFIQLHHERPSKTVSDQGTVWWTRRLSQQRHLEYPLLDLTDQLRISCTISNRGKKHPSQKHLITKFGAICAKRTKFLNFNQELGHVDFFRPRKGFNGGHPQHELLGTSQLAALTRTLHWATAFGLTLAHQRPYGLWTRWVAVPC